MSLLPHSALLPQAIFLALVVDGVQAKMEALKHGLSPVVERGHTVILGWTDATVTIVREIAAANASEGGGCIAILCERDKRDMGAFPRYGSCGRWLHALSACSIHSASRRAGARGADQAV